MTLDIKSVLQVNQRLKEKGYTLSERSACILAPYLSDYVTKTVKKRETGNTGRGS